MMGLGQWRRFWTIVYVAYRHGLQEFLGRWGRWLGPIRMKNRPRGERLRLALENLGPIFVKFGQMLSTRRDILPLDVAEHLVLLQDRVTPFPGDQARKLVEKGLGHSIETVFESFSVEPLASASIAQVHAARLRADARGESADVVVKVLRPGIEHKIRRDVALLKMMARFVQWAWPDGRRLHPTEVVGEYEKIIFDELDLIREAANASQLRRNWLDSEIIYHPTVYFDHTRATVMVMERVYGVPIDHMDKLQAQAVDFKVLAERGVEIFFQQVFRDNFFHADMHAGNIFVDVDDPSRPRYIAVDFGIVGTLSPSDQRYLAENFLAFFNRNYRRVAELHIESGWVPAHVRVDQFESAIRSVCEPIFNRPLRDISFGIFLVRLFQVARRFEMEVQPQLVLLQKTVLNIEGLGRQLYPDLDLWSTAKPILERWMRQRIGPLATFGRVREQMPELAQTLPDVAHMLVRRLQQEQYAPQRRESEQLALRQALRQEGSRQRLTLIGASLVIGAVLFAALDATPADPPLMTWLLGAAGVVVWWRAVRV